MTDSYRTNHARPIRAIEARAVGRGKERTSGAVAVLFDLIDVLTR